MSIILKKKMMRRGGLIFWLLIICGLLNGQTQTQTTDIGKKDTAMVKRLIIRDTIRMIDDFDRLHKVNGEVLIVSIKSENAKEISFIYPLNTVLNYIPLAQVKEIGYKDGTSKVIDLKTDTNLKAIKVSNNPEDDWKLVKVTYEKADVEGLPELGAVDSKAEGKKINTSIDLLERNAIIYIQKRAARMGAQKVLVTSKEVNEAYGEIPAVILKGVAYGRGTSTTP